MFLPNHHFALLILLPTIALALTIPTDQNLINQPSLTLLRNVTETNALFNASIVADFLLTCDRHLTRPQIYSCADAIGQIPPFRVIGDPTFSYGPRGQGSFDVRLPYRYISCMFPHTSASKETGFPCTELSTLHMTFPLAGMLMMMLTPRYG